jgi:hypothetical protein
VLYNPEEVDIYAIGMVLLNMANMGFPKGIRGQEYEEGGTKESGAEE